VKFDQLVFDKAGCCGSHSWAEVRHENGNISAIYDNGDGSYDVVTHAAGMLIRGQERYESQQAVEQRLMEDAA